MYFLPGVSAVRGLLIVHNKWSSKSMFMGDGDEIFFGMSWRHAHTDLNNMADYHEWLTLIGQI